jgi:hypothetical protein
VNTETALELQLCILCMCALTPDNGAAHTGQLLQVGISKKDFVVSQFVCLVRDIKSLNLLSIPYLIFQGPTAESNP